ncbi:hypothetical protein GCM10007973_23820 [Polymorphobacter multimanifer]|uniref:Cytochrome c n=1 Tax=Polymorphobacter multimanifer TaxID=1070431 RepID=A0A841L1H8_9SPHN|nr:hypothetical protein [Polymorphobacter multimanifer]MBB6226280.1 cytochrome c [Polymorphobacter multimanifer]GGI86583.1 hypothetical protein GCM10007973_23820 [Polymorphobacter multimanifer]
MILALVLAAVAADPAATRAFQKCLSCHSVTAGETGLPGPNRSGVMGRRAGSLPDFDYSPSMRAAGAAGLVWDKAALGRFLDAPDSVVPGTAMAVPPRTSAAERALIFSLFGTAMPDDEASPLAGRRGR